MYHLSVAACFKNEHHCIVEWIEHYKMHGVDHIYLINDFSTPEYLPLIQGYIDNGYVTLFHNDIVSKNVGRQFHIYNKYLLGVLQETEWMAIIDLDEFLYSPSELNFKNVLKRYSEYSAIEISWVHFGSNGHITQPKSLVEGFTMKAKTAGKLASFKTIFRTSQVKSLCIHFTQTNGKRIRLDESSQDFLINHYGIQSWDFYRTIKGTRGDCDNYYEYMGQERNRAMFEYSDINEELDERLLKQNMSLIKMDYDEVTLVITSCNRPSLLKTTLESFMKYNTYPIKECIIIEDSGIQGVNDFVKNIVGNIPLKLIYNEVNIGQLRSIDKAYKEVSTKYIFHCEEDWEFTEYGFIEDSMKILSQDEKIFTVWLRGYNCTSNHPVVECPHSSYNIMKKDFSYLENGVIYTWHGVTFNPGLRRTDTCMKLHPYANLKENIDSLEVNGEYTVNQEYGKLGYYAAITKNRKGYVKHIGWNLHVKRPWE